MSAEPCRLSDDRRSEPSGGWLETRWLGRIAYDEAVRLQDALVDARLANQVPDTLLLLEHPPTITLGRRGSRLDVYLSDEELATQQIGLYRATRGGLVTYHGPGQLVGYPLVAVRALGLTVPCYVRALEKALVAALGTLGLVARIDEEHVGVWTDRGKIAAVGVAQRHGITLHGFAVNLQSNLAHFELINPCGLGHLGVTSVREILGQDVAPENFAPVVAEAVARELGLSVRWDASGSGPTATATATHEAPGTGEGEGCQDDLDGVAG